MNAGLWPPGLCPVKGPTLITHGRLCADRVQKLQGRTLPKLILSVCKRHKPPWMTLAAFYVLCSRCRTLDSLRLLQDDIDGRRALRALKHDEYLVAWERGYTRAGWWSDDLAVAALKSLRYTRQRTRQARADAKTKKATGAKPTAARAKPKAAAAATKGGNKRTMPAEAPASAGKRAQQR